MSAASNHNRRAEYTAKAKREGAWEPYTAEQVTSWENRLGVVERTKENYRLGLASFCEFARACAVRSPADVDEDLVLGFKEFLQECGRSPSCISLYLAGVRSFLRSLGGDNPAAKVRGGKARRGFKKEALSLDEARRLLECYPGDDEASARNRAIISLMLHTGLRFLMLILSAIECSMYLTYAAVNCLADLKRGVSSNGEASGFAEPQLCPCQ